VLNVISVVVPALNEEKLLPECLESLKKQSYDGDYEVIVVDNGSTDGTSKVAVELGARVVFCPKRGVVYARQAGADAARGEIIVQADADTTYPSDWLARIAEHFSSHPQSVALAGTFVYQEATAWGKIEYFLKYLVNRWIGVVFFRRPVHISGANFAFRREAFLKAKGYDAKSLYPDQWGISRRLSRVGKVFYDRHLVVKTSSRRVQKPIYLILIDIALNFSGIVSHFVRYGIGLSRTYMRRLPLVRSPARLTASVLAASVIGVLAYGYAAPTSQVFGKVYCEAKASDKVVALSFDDGPNEPYTSEILDILDTYGIKGTFFVIGKNVELYPATARRIVSEGHVLGNHSYSHKANHALYADTDRELEQAEKVIFDNTGVKPRLYRPPHGKKSPWELHDVKSMGLIEVTWTASANEAHDDLIFGKPSPEEVAKEIIDKVKPGRIILLHDGYGTNHNDQKSDRSLTVKVLPIIIKELRSQGYEFVTVPELIGIPPYLR
jgi:peptidoglycan/xylan/chitin deacetylase (PgdA/CDA1 family)